jgi:hypothetical protein
MSMTTTEISPEPPYSADEIARYEAHMAEQAREDEAEQRRIAEGRAKLADRFAADPGAAARCARILATLGTETQSFWGAGDVVADRRRRHGDALDEKATDEDLDAMCSAGLLDVEERNDGDGEGPPQAHWGAYAIPDGAIDEFMMLGAERWLAKRA